MEALLVLIAKATLILNALMCVGQAVRENASLLERVTGFVLCIVFLVIFMIVQGVI